MEDKTNKILEELYETVQKEDFDIIDYYQTVKLSPKALLTRMGKIDLTKEDIMVYEKIKRYRDDKKLNPEDFETLSTIKIVNGHEINLGPSDNIDAINFLEKNKLPKTMRTFNATLDRIAVERAREMEKDRKVK